jgi:quercetin dioxygenase-like cupin family protein
MSTVTETAQRSFRYLGSDFKVLADSSDTNGEFAVLEVRTSPGSEPPMHIHDSADEIFIVLEGEMRLTIAGVDRVLTAGESAIVRRGIPHTFKVLTAKIHTLGVITPGGFEDFFRTLAGDPPPPFERIAQVAAQFGTHLIR